jgi:hypothetical protein
VIQNNSLYPALPAQPETIQSALSLGTMIAFQTNRAAASVKLRRNRGWSSRFASHDGLSTGFDTAGGDPFKYFRRLHVGATAWNVFAQMGFNPYYVQPVQARRRPTSHQ